MYYWGVKDDKNKYTRTYLDWTCSCLVQHWDHVAVMRAKEHVAATDERTLAQGPTKTVYDIHSSEEEK